MVTAWQCTGSETVGRRLAVLQKMTVGVKVAVKVGNAAAAFIYQDRNKMKMKLGGRI